MKNFHYVYILKCSDGKHYTGCTKDLEDRLARHHRGSVPATKDRRPVELIIYIAFSDKYGSPDPFAGRRVLFFCRRRADAVSV